MFGVCANEYSADGQVVHLQYGCGAHSDVQVSVDPAIPAPVAYDDDAVDVVVLPQQLAASARARSGAENDDPGSAGTDSAATD